ncbi:hypothetical protein JHK82_041957 [Glycine max]|nr:hypothetical protein JHK86_042012 [Glycine max]KAG5104987.1 hypothetical protein JHK82_041957 [Glycine max]
MLRSKYGCGSGVVPIVRTKPSDSQTWRVVAAVWKEALRYSLPDRFGTSDHFSAAAQPIPPPPMAKGRKLTTSRSERFLGTYAYSQGSAALNPSELREEDVWGAGDDAGDREWEPHAAALNNSGVSRRRIPRDTEEHRRVGGLSLAFEAPASGSSPRMVHQFRAREEMTSTPRGRHMATSAPVNVPDWSKILRVDSVESINDEDGDESEMMPPHEYLARSQKMVANSVFEGVGRTLKGRDLSRVRDAVWNQTGFDG